MLPIKVIYLDDEIALGEIFYDEFQSDEISVQYFSDPKIALEAIQKDRPDVVFIDYRLKGILGDEVAKKMPEAIPKYLVTGELSVKTSYQFKGIFLKPFQFSEIRKILKEKQNA